MSRTKVHNIPNPSGVPNRHGLVNDKLNFQPLSFLNCKLALRGAGNRWEIVKEEVSFSASVYG